MKDFNKIKDFVELLNNLEIDVPHSPFESDVEITYSSKLKLSEFICNANFIESDFKKIKEMLDSDIE